MDNASATFGFSYKIGKIYFNNKPFQYVSFGTFNCLIEAKNLSLRDGFVKSTQDNYFEKCVNLEELDLNNNFITKLNNGTFKGLISLISLKYLDLEFNEIY